MATRTNRNIGKGRITISNIKRIEDLRKKNYSFYEIARKLGVSMTTARYWYIKKYDKDKFLRDKEKRKDCFTKWYKKNHVRKKDLTK